MWGLGWINDTVLDQSDITTLIPKLGVQLSDGEAGDICEKGLVDQNGLPIPPEVYPTYLHPTYPITLPVNDPSLNNRITVATYWSNADGVCAPVFPISELTIGDPHYSSGGPQPFVTNLTPFSLAATFAGKPDNVASVSYRVFGDGTTPPDFTTVTGSSTQFTFNGPDGRYEIDTYSTAQDGTEENPHNSLVVNLDNTPPTSTLQVGTPRYPSGATQPFVTSATPFTVNASDTGSGVKSISYRFYRQGQRPNSFTAIPGSSTQFKITGSDGYYVVDSFTTDNVGNMDSGHTMTVYLDNTAPVIKINQPAPTQYPHSTVLTLDYYVNDGSGSGVDSVTASLDGLSMIAGHGLDSGQAINLLTELSTGTHTFEIHSVDHLHNTSSSTVTFTVVVTPESLAQDVAEFLADGCIDHSGIGNALTSKLSETQNALSSGQVNTAMNTLNAFTNQVQAQTGKHISTACTVNGLTFNPADILIGDATWLMGTLGANPSPIVGYVVDTNGTGLSGAKVSVTDSANTSVLTTTTDVTGFYFLATTGVLTTGSTYNATMSTFPGGYTTSSPAQQSFTWQENALPLSNFVLN